MIRRRGFAWPMAVLLLGCLNAVAWVWGCGGRPAPAGGCSTVVAPDGLAGLTGFLQTQGPPGDPAVGGVLLPPADASLFRLPLEAVSAAPDVDAALAKGAGRAGLPRWLTALGQPAIDLTGAPSAPGRAAVRGAAQTIPLVFTGTVEFGGRRAALIEDRETEGAAYMRQRSESFGPFTVEAVGLAHVVLREAEGGGLFRLEGPPRGERAEPVGRAP